ncbi:MAG: manganese efflux pump MntP family protein [Oscillospiraceae bacterium]|jgi:putative Mn2+ efflux pump MntP|nr:manganese efflux pump MntP family protein [Oscillospiraceae bacterium]
MRIIELFLIAVGLSMDAFAVAVCSGLSMERASLRKALTVGLYFGAFQAGMPLLGYLVGSRFADKITALDHWLAFALLAFIGGKMVWGSFAKQPPAAREEASLKFKRMLPLALATSVDALAVGVSFSFLNVQIAPAASLIGVTAFGLSAAGVKIGNAFGARLKTKAELVGGLLLVFMGLKLLLEHTGVI